MRDGGDESAVDVKTQAAASPTAVKTSDPQGHLLEPRVERLLAAVPSAATDQDLRAALAALDEAIIDALAPGRPDVAVRILERVCAASPVGRQGTRDHSWAIRAFLRTLASRRHIALLGSLLQGPTAPQAIGPVADYLRLVGRQAVEEFVALLADEPNRRVRGRMCHVLVRVGPAVIPALLHWVDDPLWYVVRNIVSILGKLGHESGLLAVTARLDHPHPRVRLEAVRAVGLIGGRLAVPSLLRTLADPAPEVRSATAKVLGSLRDDAAVPALRERLTRPVETPEDWTLKREAIEALAAIGTWLSHRVLGELASRRVWPWQRAKRRLRDLAAAALSTPTGVHGQSPGDARDQTERADVSAPTPGKAEAAGAPGPPCISTTPTPGRSPGEERPPAPLAQPAQDGHAPEDAPEEGWIPAHCLDCGADVAFETPQFVEPPARVEFRVIHQDRSFGVRHFVEARAFTASGRLLLASWTLALTPLARRFATRRRAGHGHDD